MMANDVQKYTDSPTLSLWLLGQYADLNHVARRELLLVLASVCPRTA